MWYPRPFSCWSFVDTGMYAPLTFGNSLCSPDTKSFHLISIVFVIFKIKTFTTNVRKPINIKNLIWNILFLCPLVFDYFIIKSSSDILGAKNRNQYFVCSSLTNWTKALIDSHMKLICINCPCNFTMKTLWSELTVKQALYVFIDTYILLKWGLHDTARPAGCLDFNLNFQYQTAIRILLEKKGILKILVTQDEVWA